MPEQTMGPESSAERVALWRAMHVQVDPPPHVLEATLRQVAVLAPASTFVMSFLMPLELAEPELRPALEFAVKGSRASGTPFVSFFTPEEMLGLALEAGFKNVQHVSAAILAERYFSGRPDGLRPPRYTEELLVATT